jgi:hypothetical protein
VLPANYNLLSLVFTVVYHWRSCRQVQQPRPAALQPGWPEKVHAAALLHRLARHLREGGARECAGVQRLSNGQPQQGAAAWRPGGQGATRHRPGSLQPSGGQKVAGRG